MGLFQARSLTMSKNLKEMDVLRQHLAKHQLKLTRQRELILTAFLRQEHVTAETMYHQLAKKDPHLGLATIYRTLNLFAKRNRPGSPLRHPNAIRQHLP